MSFDKKFYTLVFRGDIAELPFNPLRTDAGPYGRPIAAGRGNAFDELDALHYAIDRLELAFEQVEIR